MSKILVVEDNYINLQLVCDVLEMAGYDVLSAANGRDAIGIATLQQPDLILMDLRMPIMNGEEAMKSIKADERTSHIPIVALTASAMTGKRQELMSIGFDGYISKPYDVGKFAEKVSGFIIDK